MDEEDFLTRFPMRPWTRRDSQEHERIMNLSSQLWGSTEHMRSQLLASSPEIPLGLGLPELENLERFSVLCLKFARNPPAKGPFSRQPWGARTIHIDGREFTILEARLIIVQRAIAAIRGN